MKKSAFTTMISTLSVFTLALGTGACDQGPENDSTNRTADLISEIGTPGAATGIDEIKQGLTCTFGNWNGCNTYAPEPAPGGRYCDGRNGSSTTIAAGEMALYTGDQGGWCVTMPGGDFSDLGNYYMNSSRQGMDIHSIVNKRSGWPVPPRSTVYSATGYGGSSLGMYAGTYDPLPFVPRSLQVR